MIGIATLLAALVLAFAVHAVVMRLLRLATDATESRLDSLLVDHLRAPSRWLLPLLAWRVLLPGLELPEDALVVILHIVDLALVVVVCWLILQIGAAIEALAALTWPLDEADNVEARILRTRVRVLRRVGAVLIVVLGIGAALMTFPSVRELGASVLASAGIAGVVVGFAARPVLSNLIAGLQLALTSPIRLDDVVIVEGEWGRIEEILSTFVVVRIWDERRLIVPLTWFIENPFQNWTRKTAELHGTVFLWVDHTVPVGAIREELKRIVAASEHWDGRHASVVVTDTSERAVQVRALVSAADSGAAWNLRCEVREKLLDFLQREHPEGLPRLRVG